VHLSKAAFAGYGIVGIVSALGRRLARGFARAQQPQDA
jgi:hypothetical protein